MLSKPNFCFGILRLKYAQIVGILSLFKDFAHDVRKETVLVFINVNVQELYAFLVNWLFIFVF